MYNEKHSVCEGIIDICIYLASIRNIGSYWTKSFMFKISSLYNKEHKSFPYQIIHQKQQQNSGKSSIKFDTYQSKDFVIAPKKNSLLNEVAIFRMHVPVSEFYHAEFSVVFELFSEERCLGKMQLKYENILSLSTFMPIFFLPASIVVEGTIQTQLLGFRIPKVGHHPRSILYMIIDSMVLECNRLREKYNRVFKQIIIEEDAQEEEESQIITQFPQYHELKHQQQVHIFNKKNYEQIHRDLVDFVNNFLPEITSRIKVKWNYYTQHLMEIEKLTIQHQKTRYYQEYTYQINTKVFKGMKKFDYISVSSNLIPVSAVEVQSLCQPSKNNNSLLDEPQLNHLVVLVHGYGANSMAMHYFEKYLGYLYPHLLILNSKSNESGEDKTIQQMGRSLATEIHIYLQNKKLVTGENLQISFISHSLGGLIVRSALQHLEMYKYCMKIYICLSTPHLGHLYHNSKLTKVGMWALTTLSHSVVMKALLLTDETEKRKSYLYNLSFHHGLSWFQNVIMFGSQDDGYVSPESALLCENESLVGDESEKAKIWKEMLKNLQNSCSENKHEKYKIRFNDLENKNLEERLLGRNSHLAYLTDETFISSVLLMNRKSFISPFG